MLKVKLMISVHYFLSRSCPEKKNPSILPSYIRYVNILYNYLCYYFIYIYYYNLNIIL